METFMMLTAKRYNDSMNPSQKLFLACGFIGAMVGIIAFGAASALLAPPASLPAPSPATDVFLDFYAAETAVSISPSDYLYELRTGKQPGILVDLRTPSEYAAGHMVTAVNIPAGQMDTAQLLAAYSKLPKNATAINYCYSSYCMLSRSVGLALAENKIHAKHLTAGWLEIARDYSDYVVNGTTPGTLSANQTINPFTCDPSLGGEFGC
ncbi:MAG: rhodanese-like domain-containing protein [Candidatus Micrarchaeia archaeon]|jgi:rhodanese-related sulfurtransferase